MLKYSKAKIFALYVLMFCYICYNYISATLICSYNLICIPCICLMFCLLSCVSQFCSKSFFFLLTCIALPKKCLLGIQCLLPTAILCYVKGTLDVGLYLFVVAVCRLSPPILTLTELATLTLRVTLLASTWRQSSVFVLQALDYGAQLQCRSIISSDSI